MAGDFSPCDGYECQDFADCVDMSDDIDPYPTCVCQLGRYYDKVSLAEAAALSIEIQAPTVTREKHA